MSRCKFCPQAFVAMTDKDRAFVAAHEAACEENPERIFLDSTRNWRGANTAETGSFTTTQVVTSTDANWFPDYGGPTW